MTTTTTTKTDLLASRPSWAKSALFAVYEVSECDYMTDYFATSTKRVVFLAWSRTTKDMFAEMRKAATLFPETASLASEGKSAEHREKYSMGAGYYLKASGRYSDGWKVRKADPSWYVSGESVEMINAPAPTAVEAAEPVATGDGVSMTLNAAKNGVELRFDSKPSEAVRDSLKANGWRWSRFGGLWYRRDSPAARAFAEAMTSKAA